MRRGVFGLWVASLALGFGLLLPARILGDAVAALPDNKGFVTAREILAKSCSACHDWTGSYDTVVADGRVVPGNPDGSVLYQKIATDEMPAEGPKLTPDQKAFIRGWIAAGAPNTELPIAVPAAAAPEGTPAAPVARTGFLDFPGKIVFHEVTGFTSTALFLAAGIIGVIHAVDLMDAGHAYRDSIGWSEETGNPAVRSTEITSLWEGQQDLRWWHVGLLSGGELLYLGDALSGVSMLTDPTPGKVTKHDIHRWAFFTHASLMVAQVILGFFTTDALRTGNHDLVVGLGVAHAAVGLAIPAVMLGAGLENLLLPE